MTIEQFKQAETLIVKIEEAEKTLRQLEVQAEADHGHGLNIRVGVGCVIIELSGVLTMSESGKIYKQIVNQARENISKMRKKLQEL